MAVLTTYGGLLSARSDACLEVSKAHLHRLLRSLIDAIEFDEHWYLATYGDVASAVREGRFASGEEHYRTAGYFEDRMPRRITVDEDWYLAAHPDVTEAIAERKFLAAQQHFEQSGFSEGRLPAEGWRL